MTVVVVVVALVVVVVVVVVVIAVDPKYPLPTAHCPRPTMSTCCIYSKGTPQQMIDLIKLKNIFAAQLPKSTRARACVCVCARVCMCMHV